LQWVSIALIAAYADLFGRPLTPARRMLTAFAYAACAAVAIDEIVRLVLLWTGALPWAGQSIGPDLRFAWASIPNAAATACLLWAVWATRGAERDRLVWSASALSVYLATQAIAFLVPTFVSPDQSGAALQLAYDVLNVGVLVAPLGMTYALLNRRLLDVGFVLNRVAIFSTVSVIVVGVFILAEWAIGNWLQSANHTANLVAEAAVALGLGLSISFIHKRVEHVLDRVFFRKRHEDVESLRHFAREVAYITDLSVVLTRTVEILERHAGSSFVRIALADGLGSFGGVSENDPAILAMHVSRRPIDLHQVVSHFAGEFAYPMASGGRLVGALIVGPKRSEESYDPDESRALEDLARAVGVAVETLGRDTASAADGIHAELLAIQAAVVDGFAALIERLADGQMIRSEESPP